MTRRTRTRKTGKIKTRRVLLDQLPKNAGIPKFFSPTDISTLIKVREIDPDIGWDDAVNMVVFNSVPNIKAVISR